MTNCCLQQNIVRIRTTLLSITAVILWVKGPSICHDRCPVFRLGSGAGVLKHYDRFRSSPEHKSSDERSGERAVRTKELGATGRQLQSISIDTIDNMSVLPHQLQNLTAEPKQPGRPWRNTSAGSQPIRPPKEVEVNGAHAHGSGTGRTKELKPRSAELSASLTVWSSRGFLARQTQESEPRTDRRLRGPTVSGDKVLTAIGALPSGKSPNVQYPEVGRMQAEGYELSVSGRGTQFWNRPGIHLLHDARRRTPSSW